MIATLASRSGVSVTPVYLDLMDGEQVKAGVSTIISSKRKIDILVNNAGVPSGFLFQMTPMRELRRVFEVNFFAPILQTRGSPATWRASSPARSSTSPPWPD